MLLGGLAPGTTYSYQVASGEAVSGTFSFVTSATPGSSFSFAAVGDYGGGSTQETSIANLIGASDSQFIQTLGDNVYPDSQDPDFSTQYSDFDSRFYKPYGPAIAAKSIWVGGGNHEYYSGDRSYWNNFWMPNNEQWYSYDWGDAHILVLDTEQPFTPGSPQYQFAQADLITSQAQQWRIVAIHRPPYSSTTAASSSTDVRNHLVPLFELHDVQLVLTGHSHNYERTFPLLGGVPQERGGITYVVSGGGGNGLNQFSGQQPTWSAFRQASYEYVKVTVSPASLRLDAITDAGAVLDTATITADGAPLGAIAGTVTDATTGAPIAGASVAYSGGATVTDASGSYTLADVVAGTYGVTASAENHIAQTSTATVSAGQTTQLDFALAPTGGHTPIFADGFESGSLSAWTSSAGLAVQSGVVHSGAFAAQGNTSNGNTWAKKTLPATYSDGYARVYFDVLSYSSQVNLLRLRTPTDTSIGYVFVNASGKLALRADTAAITYTSAVSVAPGWHSLELHVVIAGSSSTTQVWFDGVLVPSLSVTTNLGTTAVGRFQLGEAQTGRTYNVVFDDAVFDTQRIGQDGFDTDQVAESMALVRQTGETELALVEPVVMIASEELLVCQL